jgi:hypothetical protein
VGSNPTSSVRQVWRVMARGMSVRIASPSRSLLTSFLFQGQVSERLKEHDWKSCGGNTLVGSNPTLSVEPRL